MIVTLDATTEDAANVQLVISDTSTNYRLMALDIPDPELKSVFASSFDTEGEIPADEHAYQNRTVTVGVEVMDTTHTLMETKIRELTQKLAKFNREPSATTPGPSTVKVAFESGNTYVFDVVSASASGPVIDQKMLVGKTTEMTLTFMCRPFARGPSQAFTAVNETSLPVARLTAASVKGDVPGLGKLTVTDAAAANQAFMHWGIRSRYYSTDVDNALFYEAEGRTVLNGAAITTKTGASGGGSNNAIGTNAIADSWSTILSTQATGGGSHHEHVGDFDVWARVWFVTLTTASPSFRLDWSQGDFLRFTSNDPVTLPNIRKDGEFVLVNLGQVHLAKVTQGAQRWEGRFAVKSSSGVLAGGIDCYWLVPVSEGSGTVNSVIRIETPSAFSARDEFDQSAGATTGKTLPVGGTWSGGGDTDDFAMETTLKVTQRTAQSDTNDVGRFLTASTPTLSACFVQSDIQVTQPTSSSPERDCVLARYVDVNNWLMAGFQQLGGQATRLIVRKRVASTSTDIYLGDAFLTEPRFITSDPVWYRVALRVDASGAFHLWWGLPGTELTRVYSGYDSVLATGGTLDDGKVGLYDQVTSSTSSVRRFDNWFAFAPITDAAVYASQSLEVRHDRVIREDSAGVVWPSVSSYDGFYLTVPPAGREARTSEIIVKASRLDPSWGPDLSVDDLTIDLDVTPRYVSVPEA